MKRLAILILALLGITIWRWSLRDDTLTNIRERQTP